MNAQTIQSSFNPRIRYEAAPAFGQGKMTEGEEKLFVIFAHLMPLIFWFWKRKDSPVMDAQGKEALNFGISMFIVSFVTSFVLSLVSTMILGAKVGAMITSGLMSLFSIAVVAVVLLGIIAAREGRLIRYPATWKFIK